MAKTSYLFDYKWSEVKNASDALFVIKKGAEAVSLTLNVEADKEEFTKQLSFEEVSNLADAIGASAQLRGLALVNCGLENSKLKVLVAGLKKNTGLETLDLSGNDLEEKGTETIAQFIQENSTIKHLELNNCDIASTGAYAFVEMAETNTTLRSLLLDDNKGITSSSVKAIFETLRHQKNIVNISLLNAYCDIKNINDVFSTLKKNQNLLYVGFPTFYNNKKSYSDSFFSEDSLIDLNQENMLSFSCPTVQRNLLDSLRVNHGLIRIYNTESTQDRCERSAIAELKSMLRRNMKLMRNEFNDILINEEVSAAEVNHQKVLILGRKNSGKSTLLNALFGNSFINNSKYFEHELKTKFMLLSKAGINYVLKEVGESHSDELSFQLASKVLTKKEQLKKTRKYAKLSKAVQKDPSRAEDRRGSQKKEANSKKSKRRVRRRFFNVPNGNASLSDSERDRREPSSSSRRLRADSTEVAPKVRVQKAGTRYRFDSTNTDPMVGAPQEGNFLLRRRVSSMDEYDSNAAKVSKTSSSTSSSSMGSGSHSFNSRSNRSRSRSRSRSMREVKEKPVPSMSSAEIVDNFNANVIARYGNVQEANPVMLTVQEISNKLTNAMTKSSANASSRLRKVDSRRSMTSQVSAVSGTSMKSTKTKSGKKKLVTEADKFGGLNTSVIDLNSFIYGIKDGNGLYVVLFNIKKILKFINTEKQMVRKNPISAFIKHNVNAIFNYSAANNVMLIGTHYDMNDITNDQLIAVNRALERVIKHKYLKLMARYRLEKETSELVFFPADCVNEYNLPKVKIEVIKRLNRVAKGNNRWGETKSESIPIKYFRALDVLKMYRKENINHNFISKDRLFEKVSEFGFATMGDLEEALGFLYRRGDIIIFEGIELLKDFVVLNKDFLYFSIYQLINRRYLSKILSTKTMREKINKNQLGHDYFLFQKKKLLSREFIELIWKHANHFAMKTHVQYGIQNQGAKLTKFNGELYFETNRAAYLYVLEIMKRVLFLTEWKNLEVNEVNLAETKGGLDLKTGQLQKREGEPQLQEVSNYFFIPSLMKNNNSSKITGVNHTVGSFPSSKSLRAVSPTSSNGTLRTVRTLLHTDTMQSWKTGTMSSVASEAMVKGLRMTNISSTSTDTAGSTNSMNKRLRLPTTQINLNAYSDSDRQDRSKKHSERTGRSRQPVKVAGKQKQKQKQKPSAKSLADLYGDKPAPKRQSKGASMKRSKKQRNKDRRKMRSVPSMSSVVSDSVDEPRKYGTDKIIQSSRAKKGMASASMSSTRGRQLSALRKGSKEEMLSAVEQLENAEKQRSRKPNALSLERKQLHRNNRRATIESGTVQPVSEEDVFVRTTQSTRKKRPTSERKRKNQSLGRKKMQTGERPRSKANRERPQYRPRATTDTEAGNVHDNLDKKDTVTKQMKKLINKIDRDGTLQRGRKVSPSPNMRNRYMLDKDRPVSLMIDFRDSHMPEGFYVRLCTLIYNSYVQSIKNEERRKSKSSRSLLSSSYIHNIDNVEFHKNFFKVIFDNVLRTRRSSKASVKQSGMGSDFEGDIENGSISTGSILEMDSISVAAQSQGSKLRRPKEEKEYIMVYNNTGSDSIVCVVRNHDSAPRFLTILIAALTTLLGEDEKNSREFGMMYYTLKCRLKLEVKNNKYIDLKEARKRGFAPWFSKNRKVRSRTPTNTLQRHKEIRGIQGSKEHRATSQHKRAKSNPKARGRSRPRSDRLRGKRSMPGASSEGEELDIANLFEEANFGKAPAFKSPSASVSADLENDEDMSFNFNF